MRSVKVEQATALASKIGIAVKHYNRAKLSRVDILVDPRNMWTKVRQLIGRTKSIGNQVTNHFSLQIIRTFQKSSPNGVCSKYSTL